MSIELVPKEIVLKHDETIKKERFFVNVIFKKIVKEAKKRVYENRKNK